MRIGGTTNSTGPERGYPKLKDGLADADSFEPPYLDKGDAARTFFYMAVRYEVDGASGNLEIANAIMKIGRPKIGKLCLLLAWHRQDSPDDWGRRRNNRIYGIQSNGNPFSDQPAGANAIWGPQCH